MGDSAKGLLVSNEDSLFRWDDDARLPARCAAAQP